jgi:hypothetical protein
MRLAITLLLPVVFSGCSASDMDYFWNGPRDGSTHTPAYRSQNDDWLERTRQSGEKARYEYDTKAFDQGRRSSYPDRSSYGF